MLTRAHEEGKEHFKRIYMYCIFSYFDHIWKKLSCSKCLCYCYCSNVITK